MLAEILYLLKQGESPVYLKAIMSDSKELASPSGWCEYRRPIPEIDTYFSNANGLKTTSRMLQATTNDGLQLVVWVTATVRQLLTGYPHCLEGNALPLLKQVETECRNTLEKAGLGWWDDEHRMLTPTLLGQMWYEFEDAAYVARYVKKMLGIHRCYRVCRINEAQGS